MARNAREYLKKKFQLAEQCLKQTIECNNRYKKSSFSYSDEEFIKQFQKKKDELLEIWTPLIKFQESYPKEPHYYLKIDTQYARVFFTPMWEDVNYFITDEKIPEKFIKNQIRKDPWSIVITRDFIRRYTILHFLWFLNITKSYTSEFEHHEDLNPYKNLKFPDTIPKCLHCGRHFTKSSPNQRYCSMCISSRKFELNSHTDLETPRYCKYCGKRLPPNKHRKAKFCMGACRTAYFRRKRSQ